MNTSFSVSFIGQTSPVLSALLQTYLQIRYSSLERQRLMFEFGKDQALAQQAFCKNGASEEADVLFYEGLGGVIGGSLAGLTTFGGSVFSYRYSRDQAQYENEKNLAFKLEENLTQNVSMQEINVAPGAEPTPRAPSSGAQKILNGEVDGFRGLTDQDHTNLTQELADHPNQAKIKESIAKIVAKLEKDIKSAEAHGGHAIQIGTSFAGALQQVVAGGFGFAKSHHTKLKGEANANQALATFALEFYRAAVDMTSQELQSLVQERARALQALEQEVANSMQIRG